MCCKYVKQILHTKHFAQYLLNKCQLLLKVSPAVFASVGVWREVSGQGDSRFSVRAGIQGGKCGVFW